jgi:hypothetical protein
MVVSLFSPGGLFDAAAPAHFLDGAHHGYGAPGAQQHAGGGLGALMAGPFWSPPPAGAAQTALVPYGHAGLLAQTVRAPYAHGDFRPVGDGQRASHDFLGPPRADTR